jgi:hypothetical protein
MRYWEYLRNFFSCRPMVALICRKLMEVSNFVTSAPAG